MIATDEQMIAAYIAAHGVTKVTSYECGAQQLSRSKRADWAKGLSKSPQHRWHLAVSYARAHGLPNVAWTDVLERRLIELRDKHLSWNEIAAALGKTKASVQMRHRYLSLGRKNQLRLLRSAA